MLPLGTVPAGPMAAVGSRHGGNGSSGGLNVCAAEQAAEF
jgi:hypothetical protein